MDFKFFHLKEQHVTTNVSRAPGPWQVLLFTLAENVDIGLMHGLIQAFLQMTHRVRL